MSGAVAAYLDLHDHPPKTAAQQEEELLAGMSAEEQKKWVVLQDVALILHTVA